MANRLTLNVVKYNNVWLQTKETPALTSHRIKERSKRKRHTLHKSQLGLSYENHAWDEYIELQTIFSARLKIMPILYIVGGPGLIIKELQLVTTSMALRATFKCWIGVPSLGTRVMQHDRILPICWSCQWCSYICLQGFLYLAELPSSPASCRIFVELNSLIHEVSWLVELEAKDARNVALWGLLGLEVLICHQEQMGECRPKVCTIDVWTRLRK